VKVLHVIRHLSPGGGCVSPFEFASFANREARAIEHEFLVLEAGGREHYTPPANVPFYFPEHADFTGVPERILSRKYDILHIHWWMKNDLMSQFLRVMINCPVPYKVLTCDVYPCGPDFRLSDVEIAFADKIVFDGESSLEAYPEIPSIKKSFVVGGTDLSSYESKPRRRNDKKFRIARGSTLTPLKCPENLIELVQPIFDRVPEAEFHIFGDGPLLSRFRADIDEKKLTDKIILRGWVKDFAAEVADFDVYLYHLPKESFASSELNLQGVMAAGIPLVVMPSDGTAWMFRHEKDSLVSTNSRDCVSHVVKLARSTTLRRQLSLGARQRANLDFGLINMLKGYRKLYFHKCYFDKQRSYKNLFIIPIEQLLRGIFWQLVRSRQLKTPNF
jgi:glycosyltransferase involved in cell wall biosynthesis